jgi:Holliday junction resolvase RusA-like endonuclease
MENRKVEEKIATLGALFAGDAVQTRNEITQVVMQLGLNARDVDRAIKFVTEQETVNPHSQLQFVIPGDPPVAKRPRASRIRNKTGDTVGIRMHAEDADDQRTMRSEIISRLPAGHVPYAGEVELRLDIFKPMLASWSPYKQLLAELGYIRADRRPDWDNYAKLITDAMRGVIFVDDSLVVIGSVSLGYSRRPRLEVTVSGRSKSITR